MKESQPISGSSHRGGSRVSEAEIDACAHKDHQASEKKIVQKNGRYASGLAGWVASQHASGDAHPPVVTCSPARIDYTRRETSATTRRVVTCSPARIDYTRSSRRDRPAPVVTCSPARIDYTFCTTSIWRKTVVTCSPARIDYTAQKRFLIEVKRCDLLPGTDRLHYLVRKPL